MKKLLLVLLVILLSGCSAVGVPYTNNPEKKLRYAESLFSQLNRPLPAESLIFESIEIYKEKSDGVGLAHSYRTYAFFLQAPVLEEFEESYKRFGFMDKTINFENRFQKAAEYWRQAIEYFDKNQEYNMSADCYFQLEKLYYLAFNDVKKACYFNQKSRESIQLFRVDSPYVKLDALGFDSFEEMLDAAREELGCE